MAALGAQLKTQAEKHVHERRELEDAVAGLNAAEATEQSHAWDEVRSFAAAAKEATAKAEAAAAQHAAAADDARRAHDDLARVREELSQLRAARDVLAAEHNKAVLDAQERERTWEKTAEGLRAQLSALQQQNDQLHAHLDAVSTQVARLDVKVESGADAAPAPAPGDLEVVRYLRREKEVRELQLELATQEKGRLEQAVARANADAAAARAELDAARAQPQHHAQYAELLAKINELSALRENAATLAEGKRAVEARVAQLEAELARAHAELAPHRARLQQAQIDLETCESKLRVVQEDAARWKARAGGLLQAGGVEEEVGKARAQFEADKAKLAEELQRANERFERLREQVHARITKERQAVAEAVQRANALAEEKAAADKRAEAEVASARAELESARAELRAAAADEAQAAEQAPETPAPEVKQEAESAPLAQVHALEASLRAKTEESDKHKQYARNFLKDKRAAEAQVQTLTKQLDEIRASLPSGAAPGEAGAPPAADEQVVAALRARVAELEDLLAKAHAHVAELEAAVRAKDEAAAALQTELAALRARPSGTDDAAVAAKEAELQAHYQPLLQSRYEDGKKEASLRNQIMVSQRDKKISKLTAEITELKAKLGGGEAAAAESKPEAPASDASAAAAPAEPPAENASPAPPTKARAARGGAPARGGRGGAPKPVPLRTADTGTSIRGAAAATRGRGGVAVAGGAKRKRELNASSGGTDDKPAVTPTKPVAPKKPKGDGK